MAYKELAKECLSGFWLQALPFLDGASGIGTALPVRWARNLPTLPSSLFDTGSRLRPETIFHTAKKEK